MLHLEGSVVPGSVVLLKRKELASGSVAFPFAPGRDYAPPSQPLFMLNVAVLLHPQLKAHLLGEAGNRFWQMLDLMLHTPSAPPTPHQLNPG